jgi:hypothetical protein
VRCELGRVSDRLNTISCEGYVMPASRQRLAVKLFRLIEGEAEGGFAISVLLVLALAAIIVVAWRIGP